MKTLKHQTLLYDADCPLCRVYTNGFISAGMLDVNGKKPFCQLTDQEQSFVDVRRASNEIALVDNENKTVIYGIDSLLKVIGFSFPWIEKVGQVQPIKFFLKKLYSFISYNRKVIIPSKVNKALKLPCVPDFSFKYRSLYIAFAGVVTSFVLYKSLNLIDVLPKLSIATAFILTVGQLVFQYLFLIAIDKKSIFTYFGNLMTVSLMGSLLLLPILFLNSIFDIPQWASFAWFILTSVTMFLEHSRRIRLLEMPFYLSITWFIYSIIALIFILNF